MIDNINNSEILKWYQEALNPQFPILERKKKIRSIIEGIAKYFFKKYKTKLETVIRENIHPTYHY